MPTETYPATLAGLRAAEEHLLSASLDLAAIRPQLTGARHTRLVELAARLDGLIATCQRLGRALENDAAELAVAE